MRDYKLVAKPADDGSLGEFETWVKIWMAEGWVPLGGPIYLQDRCLIAQAMTKGMDDD